MTILRLQDLTKRFGGITAVKELSLEVKKGEIVGLIGPNGAGKSTVLMVISGNYEADIGCVVFNGQDVTNLPCHQRVRAGVALAFQQTKAFSTKTIFEHLYIATISNSHSNKERMQRIKRIENLLGFSELDRVLLPRELSHGKLRALELGRALATNPTLLLLDEPFAGLTLSEIKASLETLEQIRGEGITIMLVDHNLRGLIKIADRVLVMHFGELLAEGTSDEVLSNPRVQEVYLGGQLYAS